MFATVDKLLKELRNWVKVHRIGWINENDVRIDRWNDKEGDAFACRYEAYLTDYRVEPHKKEWNVELAIKIADNDV